MRYVKRLGLLLMPWVLVGCIFVQQPFQKIDYYTLKYDPPTLEGAKQLPAVILVERMGVAPTYNSTKIVYSPEPFMRDAYTYHKWYSHPGNLVTYFIGRDLRQSGLFKGVFVDSAQSSATHILRGNVEEFFEQDTKDVWKAVLTLDVTLLANNEKDVTRSILFQKQYSDQEPCRLKNPHALAAAMSIAMSRISEQIMRDIYDRLSAVYQ